MVEQPQKSGTQRYVEDDAVAWMAVVVASLLLLLLLLLLILPMIINYGLLGTTNQRQDDVYMDDR